MIRCKKCHSNNVSGQQKGKGNKFEFTCYNCGRTIIIRRPIHTGKKQLINAKC